MKSTDGRLPAASSKHSLSHKQINEDKILEISDER